MNAVEMLHEAAHVPEDGRGETSTSPVEFDRRVGRVSRLDAGTRLGDGIQTRIDSGQRVQPPTLLTLGTAEDTAKAPKYAILPVREVVRNNSLQRDVAAGQKRPPISYPSALGGSNFRVKYSFGLGLLLAFGDMDGGVDRPFKVAFVASPVRGHAGETNGAVGEGKCFALHACLEPEGSFAEPEKVLVGRQ